ncbi:hypothetical protein Ocin01_19733 [Orchesella cincta]|uniref:Protein sleepless n=1 Tax=Orchesella cincta TaxID=48709 RepID=A0A1D2M1V7_ORCCI|nr:hypothetical protein Ocin01_19733 [Orchesella cincta]
MKVLLILGALCLLMAYSEGLKCYNCLYLSDKLPNGLNATMKSESSCQAGKKPKKDFIVDCSRLLIPKSGEKAIGTTNILTSFLGENHPLVAMPYQNNGTNLTVTYTCGKLSYDGTFLPYYGGKKMKAMIRSCIPKLSYGNSTFQQQCQNGKMDKLNINDLDLRALVFNGGLGVAMNHSQTDVSICTCTKDDCNGAMLNNQISIFVIIASLMTVLLLRNKC